MKNAGSLRLPQALANRFRLRLKRVRVCAHFLRHLISMHTEDYQDLYDLEANYWWFVGMRELTAVLLDPFLATPRDRTILDAGCGTGGNLEWLRRYAGNGRIVGLDYVNTALQFCRAANHESLVQASATDLPFADASFDVVTSFDVLVQIPGDGADEQAMREMWRVIKPGGLGFVRGAAYEWMKSGHDAALDTQRRYTLPLLRERLQRAGFTIRRQTYANSFLFPIAAVRRLALKRWGLAGSGSDVKPLPPALNWLNALMTAALRREARLLRTPDFQLRFGLSAICVVQKP
jgi:ubiquinone/menaquinone biosynthesis C-methylase UbiE